MLASGEFVGLRVVLVAPRNPLNIGAAARAMSNFGFSHLRVVNPYEVAFREARSAVGASNLLANAEIYGSTAEAVSDCTLVVGTTAVRHRVLQHPVWRLEEGARRMRRQLRSSAVALLFGSEKFGLSNEDLSYCHWLLHIPTREKHPSMNLGQAVAVCLYELERGRKTAPPGETLPPGAPKPGALQPPATVATSGKIERVTDMLLTVLRASGYLSAAPTRTAEEKVRRLIRRLGLSAHDAEVWLGMLRQIGWKLRAKEL